MRFVTSTVAGLAMALMPLTVLTAPNPIAVPVANAIPEAAAMPEADVSMDVQREAIIGPGVPNPQRLTRKINNHKPQPLDCEDLRLAAVHICEVEPRGGDCGSKVANWHACIQTTWGYELKN